MGQKTARQRAKQDIENDAGLELVGVIKNGAELAVVAALFSFIGTNFASREALIVSWVLKVSLAVFIASHIQHRMMNIATPGRKHYYPKIILSAALGVAVLMMVHFWVITPVLGAIERQMAATQPLPQPQDDPARAERQALPSAGTAAPKPAAAPSAPAARAPAATVPPSAAPSRSSTPEARRPS
ncbi:hypothetical protein ACGFZ3_13475 [Stenotrophomonas sp. NPDC047960]|uniref:hypothetical protein n=1 Tax=Stenotrophomonas sp. NPDC047960 TaxID=3364531 RepID=UPI003710B000